MEHLKHPAVEMEKEPKGVAFVFSNWVEKENPKELNVESKERLDKAIELYASGKVGYFLVSGGEFVPGLEKPVGKMMTDYLIANGIPREAVIEERHAKDTTSNVRFGKLLLSLKKLDDLPVYYVSSGYHLKRIEKILMGQNKINKRDTLVSSGREELESAGEKLAEWISTLANEFDPQGESAFSRWLRSKRKHHIHHKKDHAT